MRGLAHNQVAAAIVNVNRLRTLPLRRRVHRQGQLLQRQRRVEPRNSAIVEFSDRLYAARPAWAIGAISRLDARFLFERALAVEPAVAVEIGTASGVSTALLAYAAHFSDCLADRDGSCVRSYDISPHFYGDERKRVGDAAREMLPHDVSRRVTFRNPATAREARQEHPEDSVQFAFIDAEHDHPWPALDLLALLPTLKAGAEVVLHDINLPIKYRESPHWGAKYVFDDLDIPKHAGTGDPPNIGSVYIPADKESLGDQLRAIVTAHEWKQDVPDEIAAELLGT